MLTYPYVLRTLTMAFRLINVFVAASRTNTQDTQGGEYNHLPLTPVENGVKKPFPGQSTLATSSRAPSVGKLWRNYDGW